MTDEELGREILRIWTSGDVFGQDWFATFGRQARALLAPAQPQEPPPPGTVRVRIALAVNCRGDYSAGGWSGATDKDMVREAEASCERGMDSAVNGWATYFITADVDLPRAEEVAGRVEP